MDLGRLAKKARNELMRNPKKSAILAVICLVALYFWLPLVRGWLPGGKKTAKAAAKTESAAKTASPPAAGIAPENETPKSKARAEATFRWDKLARQREQDPLAAPATLDTLQRNPFRLNDDARRELVQLKEGDVEDNQPAPAATTASDLTPAQLGLVLKATLVGSRVRAATINDRTYSEGAKVRIRPAAASGEPGEDSPGGIIEFSLTKVSKDSIVLSRGDNSYPLEFRKDRLRDGDLIVLGQEQTREPSVAETPATEPADADNEE